MAIYLKQFSTHAEYDSYINGSGAILPNVSICDDTKHVHYNPYVEPTPTYDYVEIGGIKWATMNIGANSVTDYGLYFQWGDTQGYTADQVGSGEGQKYFGWADYKYGDEANVTQMTKYNSTDRKTVLEVSDDAATVNMGSDWRMPTKDEYVALGNATTSAWTTDYQGVSGCNGLLLTSTADTNVKLFFPACGFCSNGRVLGVGSDGGCYWSSSLDIIIVQHSWGLEFSSVEVSWTHGNRYVGYSVRGVYIG